MRFIKQLIENSTHLLMVIINLILYGIVFFIYEECKSAINVIDLNTENVWTTFFNHPGESIGVFISAIFLNVFIVWFILVAIVSIVAIIAEGYDNYDRLKIVTTVLNCILAIVAIILNVLFVKVYWVILIVLLVIIAIIYLLINSN